MENHNALEKLLNKDDLTQMNEKSVIQNEIISSMANEKPRASSGNNILKANGNAQLKDFIKYVGLIVESVFNDEKVEFLPDEKTFPAKEDADKRLMNPIISYKVIERKYKNGTNYVPRVRDIIVDDKGRTGELFTEFFTSKIQFQIIAMEYNVAWEIMDKFEDLMLQYRSFLKERGISNYYFCGQESDSYCQDFLEILSVLTINYYVETEKNRVIFKENINNIRIHGEAVNPDGTSLNPMNINNK